MTYTFTFSDEQHTTLIASLALAAQRYSDPEPVLDVLSVVCRPAAIGIERGLLERRCAELEEQRTFKLDRVENALIDELREKRARLAILEAELATYGKPPEPFVDDDGVELVTEDGKLTLEGAARLLGEEV